MSCSGISGSTWREEKAQKLKKSSPFFNWLDCDFIFYQTVLQCLRCIIGLAGKKKEEKKKSNSHFEFPPELITLYQTQHDFVHRIL